MKLFMWIVLLPSMALAETQLRVAFIQEWSTINPVTNQLASNEALFPFLTRKMVTRNAQGEVLPDVAESLPKLKGKVAIWKIRAKAHWGDGKTITCADWDLGWQAGLNPKVSASTRTEYEKIQKITWSEKDPKTCTVTYAQANWAYDRELPPLLPAHLEKAVYEKFKNEPEGYDRNSIYVSSPTNPGLYNGPYIISEFKLGSHAVLTRNKYFFGPTPQIDKIILQHIADTSALKAHLLSNQVDAVSAVGFPPDTALSFNEEFKASGAKFLVHFQNSSIMQGLFFNLDNEILKSEGVREALSKAVDKEKLVKAFFKNTLVPAQGIIPPQHPSYSPFKSIFSKREANQLLEKEGWKLNENGIRTKNGKVLSFVFKTSAGIKVLELIQQFICDGFKDIGVQCIIKNEPPRLLLGSSVPKGEFDFVMFGQPIPPDSSLASYFSSKEIPSAKNSWTGGNSMRIRSTDMDQLLNLFDKEMSSKQRHQIMKDLQTLQQKNFYFIPLYHRREAIVMPKALSGLSEAYDGTSYNEPEKWRLAN